MVGRRPEAAETSRETHGKRGAKRRTGRRPGAISGPPPLSPAGAAAGAPCSERAEADLAGGGLADLHIGQPVRRDQDLATVVVHQAQQL